MSGNRTGQRVETEYLGHQLTLGTITDDLSDSALASCGFNTKLLSHGGKYGRSASNLGRGAITDQRLQRLCGAYRRHEQLNFKAYYPKVPGPEPRPKRKCGGEGASPTTCHHALECMSLACLTHLREKFIKRETNCKCEDSSGQSALSSPTSRSHYIGTCHNTYGRLYWWIGSGGDSPSQPGAAPEGGRRLSVKG